MGWKEFCRACVLLAPLVACAPPPEIITTVWSGPAATQTVWYATDREPDANTQFGRHWANQLRCGHVILAIPATGTAVSHGELLMPQDCDDDASLADFVKHVADATALATDWDNRPCRRLLVVVHGFNTGFGDTLGRAGQVTHDMNWRCPVLAFSWSSEGQVDRYTADVERSAFSVPYLIGLLRALDAGGLRVDIVAHSMGNRVTLTALSAVCGRGAPHPVAGEVILAAPDVNAETYNDDFQTFLRRGAPCARRVTVYASENDLALIASESVHGGIPRAGRRPLADLQYLSDAGLGRNIDVIDASLAPGGDTGHGYYAQSYEMARDMMWVLDGATPAQRAKAGEPYDGGLTCADWKGDPCGRYVLTVAKDRRPSWRFRLLRQIWPH